MSVIVLDGLFGARLTICNQFCSQKDQRHSQAYINFKRPEDVVEFAEFFDGHIFVNEKGSLLHFILVNFPLFDFFSIT